MPIFKTQTETNVHIADLGRWFAQTSNDNQIEFLNWAAKYFEELDSIQYPVQLLAIADPSRPNYKGPVLTPEAQKLILLLAELIEEQS